MATDKVRDDAPLHATPLTDDSPPAGTQAHADAPVDATPEQDHLRSLIVMWSEVKTDALVLAQTEARLAREEISDNLKAGVRATILMVAGAAFLIFAGIFLIVAAVVALAKLVGLLWALLILGAGCAVIGAVAALMGKSIFARLSLVPKHSLHRISTNVSKMSERAERARNAAKGMSNNG